MKRTVIGGASAIILGLLIGLGPILIFKVCPAGCACCGGGFPLCNLSAEALKALGLMIAALGICMILYNDPHTQIGLVIGIFLAGLVALLIPYVLIGGCEDMAMACHRRAFPAVTVEVCVLLAGSAVFALFTARARKA
jgi:hypothetical protein